MTRASLMMLALGMVPAFGWGQATGSIAYASDLQARGMSLNDRHAAAQASLNYDTPWGLYAGASAAQARLPFTRAHALWQGYAGYAARLGNEGSWEAGVARTLLRGADEYGYTEVFAGAGWKEVSARLYYSPHYYGLQGSSLYAEVNGGVPLSDGLELQLHVGRLRAARGEYWYGRTVRTDARLGVAWTRDAWTVSAAWTALQGDRGWYGTQFNGKARAWSAGMAYHF